MRLRWYHANHWKSLIASILRRVSWISWIPCVSHDAFGISPGSNSRRGYRTVDFHRHQQVPSVLSFPFSIRGYFRDLKVFPAPYNIFESFDVISWPKPPSNTAGSADIADALNPFECGNCPKTNTYTREISSTM